MRNVRLDIEREKGERQVLCDCRRQAGKGVVQLIGITRVPRRVEQLGDTGSM